jgi:hypothetical protein
LILLGAIARPADKVLNTLAPTITPHTLVKEHVHLIPIFVLIDRRRTHVSRLMRRELSIHTPRLQDAHVEHRVDLERSRQL